VQNIPSIIKKVFSFTVPNIQSILKKGCDTPGTRILKLHVIGPPNVLNFNAYLKISRDIEKFVLNFYVNKWGTFGEYY